MRPRGMPSRRVKILPWYYTERNAPSRARELSDALEQDIHASGEDSVSVPTAPLRQAGEDA